MTPEQKQQLEQVREQQAAHSALFDAHDSYKIVQRSEIRTMLNSIDFLLSLVKSQEATGTARGATAIARDLVCNWRDEWRIPTPEPGPQLDSQSDLIARVAALVDDMQIIAATASDENPRSALSKLHKLQHEAAISMRSACVEKVRELQDQWAANRTTFGASNDRAHIKYGTMVDASRDIIIALESLSIEKPKE